jgi:hypothetical protein
MSFTPFCPKFLYNAFDADSNIHFNLIFTEHNDSEDYDSEHPDYYRFECYDDEYIRYVYYTIDPNALKGFLETRYSNGEFTIFDVEFPSYKSYNWPKPSNKLYDNEVKEEESIYSGCHSCNPVSICGCEDCHNGGWKPKCNCGECNKCSCDWCNPDYFEIKYNSYDVKPEPDNISEISIEEDDFYSIETDNDSSSDYIPSDEEFSGDNLSLEDDNDSSSDYVPYSYY